MTVTIEQFRTRCPKDIEIVEYTKCTELCVYVCKRCGKKHSDLPSVIGRRKVNCRCDGFSGATKLAAFLKQIKHLPYSPINYSAMKNRCAFKCACGCSFEARPFDIASGRSTCPECKQDDFAAEYALRLTEEFPHITLAEPYKGFRHSVLHKCKCGEKWNSKPFIGETTVRKRGCPKCDYRSGGPKLKTVEFGDRIVQVQGYENAALQYLEQHTNIKTAKLATCKAEGVPNIRYRYANKMRLYYPDFYYSPKNRLVEVKSIFTLLSVDYRKTKAKAKACMSQGYEFKLLVVEINKKTKEFAFVYKLPSNWLQMSRKDLLDFLCDEYPVKANKLRSLPTRNPYVATHH